MHLWRLSMAEMRLFSRIMVVDNWVLFPRLSRFYLSAAVVRKKVSIILDGGIQYGTLIFKAPALGADLVLLGRPALWDWPTMGWKE